MALATLFSAYIKFCLLLALHPFTLLTVSAFLTHRGDLNRLHVGGLCKDKYPKEEAQQSPPIAG